MISILGFGVDFVGVPRLGLFARRSCKRLDVPWVGGCCRCLYAAVGVVFGFGLDVGAKVMLKERVFL